MRDHIKQLPLRRLLIFGGVFWALVAAFIELAEEIIEGETLLGDYIVLLWIRQLTKPELTDAMLIVTSTGGFVAVTIITVAGAFLLSHYRRKAKAVLLVVTVATLASMNLLLKLVFARPRPELEPALVDVSTYAFPSGHAMLSSALAFTLVALLWHSRWRWMIVVVAAIYVLAVGFSRLYLGVHYPSDIVAGWCISGAWVLLTLAVLRGRVLFTPKNNK